MNLRIIILILSTIISIMSACSQKETVSSRPAPEPVTGGYMLKEDIRNVNEHLDYADRSLKTIYFAGGCFWGVEAYMARVYGVADTESGYANGEGENPSYEDVIKGDQQFAETVKVTYDPERVSLEALIDYLFRVIDPTTKDQQGNDVGVQYRTGIYYDDEKDATIVKQAIKKEQGYYDQEIKTEAEPLLNFYTAEEYHQDYLEKNPNGYCHINLHVLDDEPILPIEQDEDIIKGLSRQE
ncbi:peptide-methionine (S)-S-oxide reductase MsrA [Sporosarcina obsidiansis]|uniref:peptide-methionine (S)-S-oxide reductase MsrA n=1 Tax=Sporosarcina obsidiansis TaxID=2660748 RepID=UPI00129BE43F|nr:peptide-methionine (S)-S-oxide reductase MsrA [Sporosarcina obsidiansis]